MGAHLTWGRLQGWITRPVQSAGLVIQPVKPTWEIGILLKSFCDFSEILGWIYQAGLIDQPGWLVQ